jgi:hypothetical protein
MIFKLYKYTGNNSIRLKWHSSWNKKFEAVSLMVGYYGFWIFRNKKIYNIWACCSN